MNNGYNIADVSRITGIPKDLLRMWERRYGYPRPHRDENGDRCYDRHQLDKLLIMRQLQSQGRRPGKLVALELEQLKDLLAESSRENLHFDSQRLVSMLKASDFDALQNWLIELLLATDLRSFVHEIMVPATEAVGTSWEKHEIAIHQEHLFTQLICRLVRQNMEMPKPVDTAPRIMLTTVPGEKHELGLLMAEVLMRMAGSVVLTFGPEMPFDEIQRAAQLHRVDIIGLSFSANFPMADSVVMLNGLRQLVDPDVTIWAGGQALQGATNLPEGVKSIFDLHQLEWELANWTRTQ